MGIKEQVSKLVDDIRDLQRSVSVAETSRGNIDEWEDGLHTGESLSFYKRYIKELQTTIKMLEDKSDIDGDFGFDELMDEIQTFQRIVGEEVRERDSALSYAKDILDQFQQLYDDTEEKINELSKAEKIQKDLELLDKLFPEG